MNGVVKQSIADTCLMNISWLRIINLECFVGRMSIASIGEVTVKSDDVGHEVAPELLHISPLALTVDKFLPSSKKIFEGNDIIIAMFKLDPSQPMKAPPPTEFCRS